MSLLTPANPFIYAQFRLGGGWKGLLTIGGLYGAVIGGLVVVTLAAAGPGMAGRQWPQMLLALQVLALFVVGLLRVNAAVRGDVSSRMIESHRLMPTPPLTAVVGYVLGGSVLGLFLAGINAALGVLCCASSGSDVGGFVIANVALVAAGLLVGFVSVHMALAHRFGLFLLMFVAFVTVATGQDDTRLLPGLGLLMAAVIEPLQWSFRGAAAGTSETTVATLVGLIALATIAGISCRAATRLYRSGDAAGLTGGLGLGLIGVWFALSVFALANPDVVYSHDARSYSRGAEPAQQVVATVAVGLLLTAVPIAAAARAARDRARPPVLIPLLAAAAIVALPFVVRVHRTRVARPVVMLPAADLAAIAGYSAVIAVAFAASLTVLLHGAYRRRVLVWPIAFVWIFATWIVPLLVEAVRQASATVPLDTGSVFDVSPIGALTTLWTRPTRDRRIGPVAAQAALTLIAVGLTAARARRRRAAGGATSPLAPTAG